ncbi:MAG TPA: T9SS type A sorting domain-containing protein [Cytophagaceae bacterium]
MKRTLQKLTKKLCLNERNMEAGGSSWQFTSGDSFKGSVSFIFLILMISIVNPLQAQFIPTVSGGWDGAKIQGSGFVDYGDGRIRLLDGVYDGCEGAAVYETSDQYFPCNGNFYKCYWVVFGCDDNGADGLAFTFSTCNAITDYQVWGCGGGLGYVDACPGNKGITIEFDTFDNLGGDDFDSDYEGNASDDEIAIHKNMQAKTGPGKITGVSVPNLEDGQEHRVCISYDNTTHVLSVTIDGVTAIAYDMDNAPGMDLETYFGCVGLNQSWSAGTNGAYNAQAVSNGGSLYDPSDKICPQMLPVEFLNVFASTGQSSVIISWSTASETNNDKFVIERSSDLKSWEELGEVQGAGNSNTIRRYVYFDDNPLSGVGYYRIRQVDYDGTYAFSQMLSVNRNDQIININLIDDMLVISSNINEEMSITIRDVLGRLVFEGVKANEEGIISIHPKLMTGTYMVTVQTESIIEQKKIIRR